MDITHRDWKSLPVELLYTILKLAAIDQPKLQVCNVALVCRAWSNTAQTVAYSDITIRTSSQFKKLYNVICHSSHLGVNVKTLNLLFNAPSFPESDEMDDAKYLTRLLTTSLPNLEVLNKDNLYTWVPTLDTLLHSQLRHLRRVQRIDDFCGYDECAKYINCALLMKKRLENIYIVCLESRQLEDIYVDLQRLYANLHQFQNLVDITLVIETNDSIQVLEYVVESSRSLKNIDICWHFPYQTQSINAIPINDFSKYNPRPNIKSFKSSVYSGENDHNLLLYLMHKFTNIQSLVLYLQDENFQFNIHMVTKFLEYLSTIDELFVNGLTVDQNNLLEPIGNYLHNTTKYGCEKLCTSYSDDCPEDVTASLDIRKEISKGKNKASIQYPTNVEFDWTSYMDFLEKNGKCTDYLSFSITVGGGLNRCELPDIFFPHTLTHCSKLKTLRLKRCNLKKLLYAEANLNKKFSINELYLKYCHIQHGALKELSLLVSEINQLRLNYNRVYFPENERIYTTNYRHLQINMPYTVINRIVITLRDCRDIYHVKVFVLDDEKCYYYKVSDNGRGNGINTSTEQEYVAVNNLQHIYVSCVTKPTLEAKKIEHHT